MNVGMTFGEWLTLILVMERFASISSPFRWRNISTYIRPPIVCGVTVTVALLFNLPRFFEMHAANCSVTTMSNDNTSSVHVTMHVFVNVSEIRNSHRYQLIYHIILHCIIGSLFPVMTVSILTALTLATLKTARRSLEEISHDAKVGTMLSRISAK
jgi:hypothetical protein